MTTTLRTRDPGPELPGLVETLDSASAQHFDLAALRVGVDGLVRHRRRRRRQAVVAGGAVAAVLVAGGLTWSLRPGPDLGAAAAPVPSGTSVGPTPSDAALLPTTEPPPPPTATDPTSVPAPQVAYPIPDSLTLSETERGAARTEVFDLGDYPLVPTVQGQICDPAAGGSGASPVAGRSWSYTEPTGSLDGGLDVVVSGWQDGTGEAALADLVTDSGACVWLDPVEQRTFTPGIGSDAVAFTSAPVSGAYVSIAVVRVGDVLVAVTSYDSAGQAQADAEADRVVTLLAGRARSELAAAQRP